MICSFADKNNIESSEDEERLSDFADVHAGLRLCCLQTPEGWFSRVAAYNILYISISYGRYR